MKNVCLLFSVKKEVVSQKIISRRNFCIYEILLQFEPQASHSWSLRYWQFYLFILFKGSQSIAFSMTDDKSVTLLYDVHY